MRATVVKEFRFESAHKLPHHKGKCRHIHGHSYRLFVFINGPVAAADGMPDEGMVVDFTDVKNTVNARIIDRLDHKYLNEIPGLELPTAENIARWVFEQLCDEWYGCPPAEVNDRVPETHPRLWCVSLKETETSTVQITLDDFDSETMDSQQSMLLPDEE
jgi:6-pyruvoyltetrahydropterin/6-carboxytetrahydropterin synthase